jgi:predicted nucleic acid-binding protein
LLSPLLAVTYDDLERGMALYEGCERLGAFDAVLAAAKAAAVDALVSADTDFAEIAGLRHLVPDAAGVGTLLSAR